jgi:hypothetical protein
MAGDYTRLTLDPLRDRAMVLEQQGRVHLDSDFNELAGIMERRLRVETRDLVGPAVYPAVEPDGFKIAVDAAGVITIGRGRMYVDGLMPENHGSGTLGSEPVWGERRHDTDTTMIEQPYLGTGPTFSLQTDGIALIYLDVWQRELTAVEDPSIIEPALGVDTCTRVQTAWQVRSMDLDTPRTCDFDWNSSPQWLEIVRPSAGRLSSAATMPPQPTDPCAVAPVGGYRGLENRLYRVEIHDPGAAGEASIKWSRDNGSVASRVTAIGDGPNPIIAVERLGRDDVLRFHAGQWVELLDDALELDGKPGVMRQVLKIDPTQGTVTLSDSVTVPIDIARNARLRRWDQSVGLAGGVVTLSTLPSTVALEDGIEVTLSLAAEDPDGIFRTGDWWVFAARASTAAVEELNTAPPRGVRHHFARLALVNGPEVSDCRVPWPGECDCHSEDGSCDCEACVTAKSHNEGTLTIQVAINHVIRAGGGRVCLAAGDYLLDAPLTITKARSLTLAGAGEATRLVCPGDLGIVVQDSIEVSLERFALLAGAAAALTEDPPVFKGGTGTEIAVALINTLDCRVQRCFVVAGVDASQAQATLGIGLAGSAVRTRLLDNVVLADVAVGDITPGRSGLSWETTAAATPGNAVDNAVARGAATVNVPAPPAPVSLASADLAIEDNLLLGIYYGIEFGASTLATIYAAATRIERNCILGGREAGISLLGFEVAGAENVLGDTVAGLPKLGELAPLLTRIGVVAVQDNVVSVFGDGIRATVAELLVERNCFHGAGVHGGLFSAAKATASAEESTARFAHNTISDFSDIGIDSAVASVQIIGNRLARLGTGGIRSRGWTLTAQIDDNVVLDVGLGAGNMFGIFVEEPTCVTICRNVVQRFAPGQQNRCFALGITYCDRGRIEGNELVDLGSSELSDLLLGITVGTVGQALHVSSNTVSMAAGTEGSIALAIGGEDVADARAIDPGTSPNAAAAAVLVRGNIVRGSEEDAIPQPLVLVAGNLDVTMSDNRYRWAAPSRGIPIVVVAVRGATIVASNCVEGPPREKSEGPGIDLRVPPGTSSGKPLAVCSVLGNLTSGPIDVNGGPLANPWDPLNINTW